MVGKFNEPQRPSQISAYSLDKSANLYLVFAYRCHFNSLSRAMSSTRENA